MEPAYTNTEQAADRALIHRLLNEYVPHQILVQGLFLTATGKSYHKQDLNLLEPLDATRCPVETALEYLHSIAASCSKTDHNRTVYYAGYWDPGECCGHRLRVTLIGFTPTELEAIHRRRATQCASPGLDEINAILDTIRNEAIADINAILDTIPGHER